MDNRKPKILVRYDEIFNQDLNTDDILWDEVFLLRPNVDYLTVKLRECTLEKLMDRLRTLLERSAVCVSNETSICVYNACQIFTTVLEEVVVQFGLTKAIEVLFDDAERCFTAILRRFYFFIVENVHDDLKSISLHFIERLAVLPAKMEEIPLLSSLIFSPSFDVFSAVFAQSETLIGLGNQSMRTLSVMLSRVKGIEEKTNPLMNKFSSLHDELTLQGLAQLILEQIELSNERAEASITGNTEGILSRLSYMFSGPKETKEPPSIHDSPLDISSLFILFEAIRCNKTFVSTILNTRSTLESSTEEKERSLLLRHFFTFCSLAFEESKGDPGFFAGRLCLLSLLRLTDDVFVQNSLHDPHNISAVSLYRPAMLHRSGVFDCRRPACTLGSTALDLITELLVSHLKIGFPLEFHELGLGIVHRILAYQKNRCIRMSHWQGLFNAMLALLRFLLSNESKFTVSIYPLAFRIMIVINLFLTFGDTFLPSGEAYDLLYYELVRQEGVFGQLTEHVERRLQKEKDSDWEMVSKVKNHLINPMIIINTIKEKITGEVLEQEEIIEVIRSSFETLSLKLYDGLTTVSAYDDARHIPFFLLLSRTLNADAEKRKLEESNIFDYPTLVDNLSSIL